MKFNAVITVAIVTMASPTIAQKSPDQTISPTDNACALFATHILTGMRPQTMSSETAFQLCNSHPTKSACNSTKSFIEENIKDVPPDERARMPVLTCDGSSAK